MNKFLMPLTKANARPLHFGNAMITYLEVRNLAIVEELALEPGPGLNVLTGETSAGMDTILEIHGQHDSQARVAGQSTRELLDEFGGHDLGPTHEAFRSWQEAAGQLRELTDAQRDRTLRLDLLKYQIDEIAAAKL